MITIAIELHGVPFTTVYDSGSQVSIIGVDICEKLKLSYDPRTIYFKMANNQSGNFIGTIKINTKIGHLESPHLYHVLPGKSLLIGLDVIFKFGLEQSSGPSIKQSLEIQSTPNSNKIFNVTIDESLNKMLEQYSDIFAQSKGEVGRIKSELCYINTTTQLPIHLKPYRTSPDDQSKLEQIIDEHLRRGLIRKSKSQYGFPAVLVDKKDDGAKSRLCVDYRKLNHITIDDHFPMPLIEDVEDKLLGSKWFTIIDVSSGFHHIAVAEEDIPKTAFITSTGKFEWLVMPFGLKNAPIIFQRTIHNLILDYNMASFCQNYIDDIIIFSHTFEEHILHLKKLFGMLRKENIKLKKTKCEFARNSVAYLGYQISYNKIEPIFSKVQAIKELPAPTDLRAVRSFIGKINYYKKFIPNRSELLTPLYDLTRKNVKFVWTDKEQEAFDRVKQILSSEPAVGIFNPGKDIIIRTDASEVGIGAVLKQKEVDGQLTTIAYFSKKLLPYQRNYHITERECLAIVEAIENWHYYLAGRKFTVESDHQPLEWLMKTKHTKTRLFNWSLKLSQYNFTIEYIPGKENVEADHLSRNPVAEVNQIDMHDLKSIQAPFLYHPPHRCITKNGFIGKPKGSRFRYYIPPDVAQEILWEIHEKFGHIGHVQMSEHFAMKYYTEKMNQIIVEIINSCDACLRTKQGPSYGTLGRIGPSKTPFDIIFIDTVGGMSGNSNKRYLHLAIDAMSRYIWGYASKTQTYRDFENLVKIIQKDGKPKLIVADRYVAIKSFGFKKYLQDNGIELMFTPIDHPQSNGMVERANQTITRRLRCKTLMNPSQAWTTSAKMVIEEYNKTIHTVTKFPPIYLLFGYDEEELYKEKTLDQNRLQAIQNSDTSHIRNKEYYDQKIKNISFNKGEYVLIVRTNKLNRRKLDPAYEGPYIIEEQYSPHMYVIDLGDRKESYHVSKIKRYTADTNL